MEAISTVIICIVLVIIAVFALKSSLKRFSRGCCGTGGEKESVIQAADTDKSHYPYEKQIVVEGMTCKNCAARVENAFHQTEGFYASVNLGKGMLTLLSKEPVEDGIIRSIVAKAGYMAREIKTIR